ncbi:TPR-like protein [Saitoella complicata NRRL Y-17804]|nr:TPR-like protein [Saitoella complicata NRRL Y-17804]ODQ50919.1 TPR-like protein [Saitoella complicata NRRL Y-17804]
MSANGSLSAEEHKALGNEAYKKGDYQTAISEYTHAVDSEPLNPVYLGNRAMAYVQNKQYDLALADSLAADRLAPGTQKTLARIAKCYTLLGRADDALDVYKGMSEVPAEAGQAHQMKNLFEQATNMIQAGSAQAGLALNVIDQAERLLGPTVAPPKKFQILRAEALCAKTPHDYDQANAIAMSLLRKDQSDPESLTLRGKILYAQGENEKAVVHFQQALRCDPDFVAARSLLKRSRAVETKKAEGNAAFKAGNLAEAKQKYTEALEVDPESRTATMAKLYSNRATVLMKLEAYADAIDDCTKALELDPSYTKALRTRARAHLSLESFQSAITDLNSALELDPSDSTLRPLLREAELELKKSQRKDYYKILGVGKDAGETEIKKAYRRAALRDHPDKAAPEDREAAEAKFKDINEAYTTLSDPQKKYRYDSGADIEMDGGMGGAGFGGGVDLSEMFGGMGGMGGHPFGGQFGGGGFGGGGGGHPFGGQQFGGGGNPFGGGFPGGGGGGGGGFHFQQF